jgi:ferredoxin
MSYVIAEPCVDHMDQSCVAVCPVDCISSEPGVDRKLHIDPDGCIECGSCLSACPNDAIYPLSTLPAQWADYAWIDAAWFRDQAMARNVLAEVLAEASAA